MKKEQIINWIIFLTLHYFCTVGLLKMGNEYAIRGICSGSYGLFSLEEFDPSKDTIFWWIMWELLQHVLIIFMSAGFATLAFIILWSLGKSEPIADFILKDFGSKKKGELYMQRFPWFSILYLLISFLIFRNITIFLFC
jgi:hypothetical protein|tara:strand:- start:167 stop:583 length:417 start_codon:yes stop_codon:yes gene_type:complete